MKIDMKDVLIIMIQFGMLLVSLLMLVVTIIKM